MTLRGRMSLWTAVANVNERNSMNIHEAIYSEMRRGTPQLIWIFMSSSKTVWRIFLTGSLCFPKKSTNNASKCLKKGQRIKKSMITILSFVCVHVCMCTCVCLGKQTDRSSQQRPNNRPDHNTAKWLSSLCMLAHVSKFEKILWYQYYYYYY